MLETMLSSEDSALYILYVNHEILRAAISSNSMDPKTMRGALKESYAIVIPLEQIIVLNR